MKMYTSVMENAVLVTCKTTGSRPLMMNGLLWLVVSGDLQGHPLWLFLVAVEPFSNWNILVPLFYLYVICKYMCCHHEFSWKWNTAPVTLNNNQSINQSIKVYYHLCERIAFAHFWENVSITFAYIFYISFAHQYTCSYG